MTISPTSGPTTGSTSVKISGGPWDPETIMFTTVMFGGYAATNVDQDPNGTSDGTNYSGLIATTPSQSAGKVDVIVTTPDKDSGTTSGTFTYEFIVSGIVPNSGKADDVVIISGNDLANVSEVDFGGSTSAQFGSIDPLRIWAIAPSVISGGHVVSSGGVDVTVKSPRGSDKKTFTYS
jgi:IPT/TIG domain